MSPEKIRLLNKLNNLNAKWSNDYLKNQGSVNVNMVQTERDIKSTRNAIKYEDVQENLRATGQLVLSIIKIKFFSKGTYRLFKIIMVYYV